jgi:hypothetical protein
VSVKKFNFIMSEVKSESKEKLIPQIKDVISDFSIQFLSNLQTEEEVLKLLEEKKLSKLEAQLQEIMISKGKIPTSKVTMIIGGTHPKSTRWEIDVPLSATNAQVAQIMGKVLGIPAYEFQLYIIGKSLDDLADFHTLWLQKDQPPVNFNLVSHEIVIRDRNGREVDGYIITVTTTVGEIRKKLAGFTRFSLREGDGSKWESDPGFMLKYTEPPSIKIENGVELTNDKQQIYFPLTALKWPILVTDASYS